MTDRMTFRTFPTAFKLKAIKRLEAGGGDFPERPAAGNAKQRFRGRLQNSCWPS
jgi:hypothetical protein